MIKSEPNWDALPADLPPALDTVLRRCLQKDPRQRVRDVGDVRLAMEGAFESSVTVEAARVTSPAPRRWTQPRWAATGAALGMLAALGTGWVLWVAGRPDLITPVRRFPLGVPASVDLSGASGTRIAPLPRWPNGCLPRRC